MSLSKKLKDLRDQRNWSQQTLADLLNLSRSQISKYETGKSIPTYHTVIKLTELYQVNKEYLVNELDQLLPKTELEGYLLKEDPENKEIALLLPLIQSEEQLRAILLELHLMSSKKRKYCLKVITDFIKHTRNEITM